MGNVKVGIITQARMTSTRLPGKILKTAKGLTLLQYHIDRLKTSGYPVYIATTTNDTDDPVAEFSEMAGISYIRGSETNVLERFYQCAEKNQLDVIVRVTSDCPLIDGSIIKEGIENYLEMEDPNLYYSNALIRSYPRGFDFEIFSFELLKEAHSNAELELDKEHVTPYINRNRSGHVTFGHFVRNTDKSNYRVTVDTQEDFELVKTLIEDYDAAEKDCQGIIDILDKHPELVKINAHIEQKKS